MLDHLIVKHQPDLVVGRRTDRVRASKIADRGEYKAAFGKPKARDLAETFRSRAHLNGRVNVSA